MLMSSMWRFVTQFLLGAGRSSEYNRNIIGI